MSRICQTLLTIIALAMLVMGAGCRGRAEADPFSTFPGWPSSRNRAAANSELIDDETDVPAETDDFDPVSLEQLTPATPQVTLEAAGALLEQDAYDRTVGIDLTASTMSLELVRAIAELTQVQWVDVRGTRLTDEHLAIITTLPRLELLALSETLITDAGIKHLRNAQSLRFLSLDRTSVTDDGLLQLATLPRLEAVSVVGTRVTPTGARGLEARLPDCQVIHEVSKDADQRRPVDPPRVKLPDAEDLTTHSRTNRWSREPAPVRQSVTATSVASLPVSQSPDRTSQQLQRVLQQKLLDPDVLQALAQHLSAQKNYPKAARALEALVALQPNNQQARFDLGVALARSGDFDRAQQELLAVIDDAAAYFNLGVIAYEQQRPAQSEWYFRRALEVSPEFAEARQWLQRVRPATISPASHRQQTVDTQDVLNLLLSEFGTRSEAPATSPATRGTGIEIVPSKSPKQDQPDPSVW